MNLSRFRRINRKLRAELDIIRKVLRDAGEPDTDEAAIAAAVISHSHFLSNPGMVMTTQAAIEEAMIAYAVHAFEAHTGKRFAPVRTDDGHIGFVPMADAAH